MEKQPQDDLRADLNDVIRAVMYLFDVAAKGERIDRDKVLAMRARLEAIQKGWPIIR